MSEIITVSEIILIVLLSGISTALLVFLLSQRSQLNRLQKELQETKADGSGLVQPEVEKQNGDQSSKKEDMDLESNFNEFSENLQIIKNLQSKLDGLAVELKIRGEMIVDRDNKIVDLETTIQTLEKKISDLEAQISIFKGQIAPTLEQTITDLRDREDKLEITVQEQLKKIQDKDSRIKASQKILERAGMGNLVVMEDFQIEINKKDGEIQKLKNEILKLTAQVEQLPYICLQLTNEIKKRDNEISTLNSYNKVLIKKLKAAQDNMKEVDTQTGEKTQELTHKIMELQEFLQAEREKITLLDKEILMLNSLVMEKERKINKLEDKIKLLF